MLLALVGVTGVGKTFFMEQICNKLNFKKVNTIRTRPIRVGENPKYFMSEEELNKMYDDGKIAYKFNVFGGQYGYTKEAGSDDKIPLAFYFDLSPSMAEYSRFLALIFFQQI